MNGIDLSCFDSAASVEFGVLEFLIELSKSFIVVCLVFLILHFEAQHNILADFTCLLTLVNILHEVVDFAVSLLYVAL